MLREICESTISTVTFEKHKVELLLKQGVKGHEWCMFVHVCVQRCKQLCSHQQLHFCSDCRKSFLMVIYLINIQLKFFK